MQSQHRTLAFGVLIGFAVLGVGDCMNYKRKDVTPRLLC